VNEAAAGRARARADTETRATERERNEAIMRPPESRVLHEQRVRALREKPRPWCPVRARSRPAVHAFFAVVSVDFLLPARRGTRPRAAGKSSFVRYSPTLDRARSRVLTPPRAPHRPVKAPPQEAGATPMRVNPADAEFFMAFRGPDGDRVLSRTWSICSFLSSAGPFAPPILSSCHPTSRRRPPRLVRGRLRAAFLRSPPRSGDVPRRSPPTATPRRASSSSASSSWRAAPSASRLLSPPARAAPPPSETGSAARAHPTGAAMETEAAESSSIVVPKIASAS